MNRINQLFRDKKEKILSVFFTAGFPSLNSTPEIIEILADAGADMIEIGIPFSDPMADGPVIQKSSDTALKNGMNLKLLFHQVENIRKITGIPLLLMGYLNPVLQYGMDKFCEDCRRTGIDGVILPDLPLEVFLDSNSGFTHAGSLQDLFIRHDLHGVFLISPQTSFERVRKIDAVSRGFIYMVSSSSTTGKRNFGGNEQVEYFDRIKEMRLKSPLMIGFNISDHAGFSFACKYAGGAIIGSAFVRMISEAENLKEEIHSFVKSIRGERNQ